MTTKSMVLLVLLSLVVFMYVQQSKLLIFYSSVVQMRCFVICAHCCRIPGWTTEASSDWGALETVPQKHLHQMWDTSLPSASSQLRWHEHTGIALQLTKTPAHLCSAGTCFFIADLGSILSWECHILRSISITPRHSLQQLSGSTFVLPSF